jgi:transcriptional regulator with XRE-family HTH domain
LLQAQLRCVDARSYNAVMMRAALEAELNRRRARNARYSLRAFAHSLGLDHSTLSQILRGERTLTLRMAERLEARLQQAYIGALIDLVGEPDFRADSRWCADRLGIGVDRVNIIVQRLVREGRVRMEGPKWVVQ